MATLQVLVSALSLGLWAVSLAMWQGARWRLVHWLLASLAAAVLLAVAQAAWSDPATLRQSVFFTALAALAVTSARYLYDNLQPVAKVASRERSLMGSAVAALGLVTVGYAHYLWLTVGGFAWLPLAAGFIGLVVGVWMVAPADARRQVR